MNEKRKPAIGKVGGNGINACKNSTDVSGDPIDFLLAEVDFKYFDQHKEWGLIACGDSRNFDQACVPCPGKGWCEKMRAVRGMLKGDK